MYFEKDIIKEELKNYLKILGNNFGPETKDKKNLFTLKKKHFMGKKKNLVISKSPLQNKTTKKKKVDTA